MNPEFVFPADEFLLLGQVAKAQGLRGELKLFLYSGQPENVAEYRELFLVDKAGVISAPLVIVKSRIQGKTVIVQSASIVNRTQAEAVEGLGVLLAKKDLPAPGDNEYYWRHYQGKEVVDVDGKPIGVVERLFSNGAQDVLVVKAGKNEVLIPVIKNIIVDETGDKLIIDPPPGLLELNTNSDN